MIAKCAAGVKAAQSSASKSETNGSAARAEQDARLLLALVRSARDEPGTDGSCREPYRRKPRAETGEQVRALVRVMDLGPLGAVAGIVHDASMVPSPRERYDAGHCEHRARAEYAPRER